jgi:F-type H+-transporting ATPase subunit delta
LRNVAHIYAAALADVAVEQHSSETLKKELAAFAGMFAASADLRNFLETPAVDRAGKQKVIEALVTRMGASKELRNFLFVIVENQRAALLPEIARAFDAELLDRLGMAEAEVTSTRELTAEQKTELDKALEGLTGKKIETRYRVDAALLGGTVVRVGSTIYDGSVRAQLERLGARLAAE